MTEEWRPVKDFPEYEVSNLGRVKRGDLIMKQRLDSDKQYWIITLRKDKSPFTRRVHRLEAEAFLPNPEDKPEIDHLNRDGLDNCLENLRWATRSENLKNRSCLVRSTNTGEPFISFEQSTQMFRVFHRIRVKTLEEAIVFRDSLT
jgi:hypothetical protein